NTKMALAEPNNCGATAASKSDGRFSPQRRHQQQQQHEHEQQQEPNEPTTELRLRSRHRRRLLIVKKPQSKTGSRNPRPISAPQDSSSTRRKTAHKSTCENSPIAKGQCPLQ